MNSSQRSIDFAGSMSTSTFHFLASDNEKETLTYIWAAPKARMGFRSRINCYVTLQNVDDQNQCLTASSTESIVD
jgi:hypothetical protein